MNRELRGQLKNSVLVLMVSLVWSSLVLPTPVYDKCYTEELHLRLKLVRDHLRHEATILLKKYEEVHNIHNTSVPDDVPGSTITGMNFAEKLRDIYTKNQLFKLHLSQVEKYQKDLLTEPHHLNISIVIERLSHHFHAIKAYLTCIDPETPEPTPPPALPERRKGDYQKKVYGWGVLLRLTEWTNEDLNVLSDKKLFMSTFQKLGLNFNKLKRKRKPKNTIL